MRIELYTPEDMADMERVWKRRALDPLPFPDFSNPLVLTNHVARADNGEFVASAYTRITAETCLVLDDKAATNRDRMRALYGLHESTRQGLREKGVDSAVCYPTPVPGFVEILKRFGWKEPSNPGALIYLI